MIAKRDPFLFSSTFRHVLVLASLRQLNHHEALITAGTPAGLTITFDMLPGCSRAHLELGGLGLDVPLLVQLQAPGKCPLALSDREEAGDPRLTNNPHVTG